MNSGSKELNVNPGDTQTIVIAQLIARGTSNLNSVTELKLLSDIAQNLYNSGFVIGVEPISSTMPRVKGSSGPITVKPIFSRAAKSASP